MNKRKKASYGMKKMRGGDYMEPSIELKFGAPRDKAKNGRVRATSGTEIMENAKNYGKNPSYGNSPAAKARKAKVAAQRASRATPQEPSSNVKSKVDSKGNQIIGTDAYIKEIESIKAKSNPYSKAKKADANLDSYIAKRKGLKKGSSEYNAVQNKINKAYGKGPTNRPTSKPTSKPTTTPSGGGSKGNRFYPGEDLSSPGPTKKLKRKEAAPIDSGAREFKLKTNRPFIPTPKSGKERKAEAKTAKKVGKIQDRRAKAAGRKENREENKSNRSADRQFNQNERQGNRADKKQGRVDTRAEKSAERESNRASNKQARGSKKQSKANQRAAVKAVKAKGREDIKAARKMLKGGVKPGRKKAVAGAVVQGAAAGLQGIGKLTDAIAGKETKFGKIAGAVGQTAGAVGGMMGGIPGDPMGKAMSAVPSGAAAKAPAPGEAPPAGAPPPMGTATTPATTPPADPATAQVEQQANMPMKRGGKKKKGMMKYKAGGAKTESMKSALKDRRARKGKMK